jgi:threonine dehydratase
VVVLHSSDTMSLTCVFASSAGQRESAAGYPEDGEGLSWLSVTTIPPLVQADDVVAARELLRDVISPTPMLYSRVLSDHLGGPVYLKCENLQRTGSFKVRGAYVRIARLSAAERARGVVAASAGNHAQGVAFASGLLGTRATVVMPARAPIPKVEATRSYGASVVLHGSSVEDALEEALGRAASEGSVFIHPFDHTDVIAGQGTLGFEIIEQCPQVRTILVPTGGGGLAAGVAVATKSLDPDIRVVGVQAGAVAPYPLSLAAGHPVPVAGSPTMADGIAVHRPGDIAYGILSAIGDGFLTVSEAELSRALLLCLERAKQVVEPSGAAAVAALLSAAEPGGSGVGSGSIEPPVVVVLSGGNIDPLLLSKLLRHGLSAAGRYLGFRCRLPDHPGSLAALLGYLADLGANVLEVSHERLGPSLRVDEVEVVLQVETRGPEHCADVKEKLKAAGYTLDFS